jgi:hypothetical protein
MLMKPEERDLLAAYAHGLLDGDQRRRAAELAREDPEAGEELRAIRLMLDEAAGWEPGIPDRLNELPVPTLEREFSAPRQSWGSRLAKAAALLAVGFSLGYAIRPDGVAGTRNGGETLSSRPNVAATPTPTPSAAPSITVASNDLLASGIAAYLGYSVASNKDISTNIDKASEFLERLPQAGNVWNAISGRGGEKMESAEQ